MSYKDPETAKAAGLKYRETHREALREQSRKYYKAHREECIEKMKKYHIRHREVKKRYYRKHIEKYRMEHIQRTFGLTPEAYEELFAKQENKCAICGALRGTVKFAVDHDHKTNRVRGILCTRCNSMLGMARDNTVILESGIQYLLDIELKETKHEEKKSEVGL